MKRSEIYLKAAKEMEKGKDSDYRYGCHAIRIASGLTWLDIFNESNYPEFELFKPTASEQKKLSGTEDGWFNQNNGMRLTAMYFAHHIAKSEGN